MSFHLCGSSIVLSTWQIHVLLLGTFWDFILFFNIFDLPLVESMDAKPVELDGRL